MRWTLFTAAALALSPQVGFADAAPDCKAMAEASAKRQCLETSIAILEKQATPAMVQTGRASFGQTDPDWTLQLLPGAGQASWTSPPIAFAQPFAAPPQVIVAIAGLESGINADTDLFGFSAEAANITETGFRVVIRRTKGSLYGVTVSWLASGAAGR